MQETTLDHRVGEVLADAYRCGITSFVFRRPNEKPLQGVMQLHGDHYVVWERDADQPATTLLGPPRGAQHMKGFALIAWLYDTLRYELPEGESLMDPRLVEAAAHAYAARTMIAQADEHDVCLDNTPVRELIDKAVALLGEALDHERVEARARQIERKTARWMPAKH